MPHTHTQPHPLQRRLARRFAAVQAGGVVLPVAVALQVRVHSRRPLGCVDAIDHSCQGSMCDKGAYHVVKQARR